MRRFFVESIHAGEGRLAITGREAKHITRVLRMGPGDRFALFDRKGSRFQVSIESVDQGNVTVLLEKPLPAPPSAPVHIAIGQAILKSSAMDLMIQKTTELGVNTIYPLVSERTIVRPEEGKRAQKTKRWQDIAIAASKQSDRSQPPEIMPVMSFQELLRTPVSEQALKIILWEEEETTTLKSLLRPILSRSKAVVVVVGPEGGFNRREISLAAEGGFVSVSLGFQTLRAETAAIAVAAALNYEFADPDMEETAR